MTVLPLHPLADVFPAMPAEEFTALKQSIQAHGQLEPVTVCDGKVIDGRHRVKACVELGIAPQTVEYTGDDPMAFVIAKNLARRHLNESQRAMVADKLATLKHGQRKPDAPIGASAQQEAADLLRVARRSVQRARFVRTNGAPELVAAVERGDITVSAAKEIAALPEHAQRTIALTKDHRERRKRIKAAKGLAKTTKELERLAAAEPLTLVSKRAVVSPAERAYSIAEWDVLSTADRQAIIEAGFDCKAKMNDQPSDAIEWARRSLNTVTGCLHDCTYCYARDIANSPRSAKIYPQKFAPTFHPSRLSAPARERVPPEAKADAAFRNVFANSMSDLFGQWVPKEWIDATIEMARRNPQWNFLTLTKFPNRAADFEYPENWWMGTTVDAQARVANAEKAFAKVKCGTKWLSVEPLLQPLQFSRLDLFQWIVIGGASSSSKTPAWIPPLDWLVGLHAAARNAGLRIYYKTNCGMQDELRVREFPWTEPKRKDLPKSFRYLKGM